jgi:hypothetical protein
MAGLVPAIQHRQSRCSVREALGASGAEGGRARQRAVPADRQLLNVVANPSVEQHASRASVDGRNKCGHDDLR